MGAALSGAMKNKKARTLKLDKETLRALDPSQLHLVGGGATFTCGHNSILNGTICSDWC
jgi:hypothetical protein